MLKPIRPVFLGVPFCVVLMVAAVLATIGKKSTKSPGQMDEQKRAIHALNRLTFGSRPCDVQQVLALGVDQWIDLELHPERIDNHALDARLEQFRTLRMSTKEMVENFPPP